MRNSSNPATRHIPRRCGTCKWWKLKDAVGGYCQSPQILNCPVVAKMRRTKPDEGHACGLWQPIQSEIRRADGTFKEEE